MSLFPENDLYPLEMSQSMINGLGSGNILRGPHRDEKYTGSSSAALSKLRSLSATFGLSQSISVLFKEFAAAKISCNKNFIKKIKIKKKTIIKPFVIKSLKNFQGNFVYPKTTS